MTLEALHIEAINTIKKFVDKKRDDCLHKKV